MRFPINITKDANAIVYNDNDNDTKLVIMTKFLKEPIKVKRRLSRLKTENYKLVERNLNFSKSSRPPSHLDCADIMQQKIARINWNRRQYSEVFCSAIVDPSPLKKGQKVSVLWGTKTQKEITAVISVYPVNEQEANTTEDVLPPHRKKAKRKLVCILFIVLMKHNAVECRFRAHFTALYRDIWSLGSIVISLQV